MNEMVFQVYSPFVKTYKTDDSATIQFQLNPADVARAIAAKDVFKPLGEFEIVLRPIGSPVMIDPATGEVWQAPAACDLDKLYDSEEANDIVAKLGE